MSDYEAVDEFLMANAGLRLEEVLCDGCFIGRLSVLLGERARIMPRLTASTAEPDGGLTQTYEGILVLDDIWYRFRCQMFVDQGGQRFLSDVSAFAAVEWKAKLAVPAA